MFLSWLRLIVDEGNRLVWSTPSAFPWFVGLLLGTGVIITFWMGWIQVRRFRHAIDVTRGKFDDPDDDGDINHFQALTTALSATVGIGNIAGVAIAIHWGGPGALFWMWITALFGMALKYAECTLAVEYRVFDDKGGAAGGPMYYIERGLGKRFKPLAVFFAVMAIICSFGSGNMNQANTISEAAFNDLGHVPYWVSGGVAALLVGAVILGGIKRIGAVTGKLAPAMALFYVAGGVVILLLNYDRVPSPFVAIFSGAFRPTAGVGGAGAGVLLVTLVWGIKRGLFSNEAGQGSAPIAHAAAKTDEPVREGTVAMMGPFIDTLVICTITGLVIVTTGVWRERELAIAKFGDWELYTAPAGEQRTDSVVGLSLLIGRVTVTEGRPSEGVLAAYDGFVEDGRLLDDQLRPFTGVLERAEGGGFTTPDGRTPRLRVRGEMLRTGSSLTSWAFRRGLEPLFGQWGYLIVTLSVFLFGLSTTISWSYYGDRCTQYLLGTRFVLPYRVLYVFFVFLGAQLSLKLVWDFGDLALGLMALPNLVAVLLLAPKVRRMTSEYFARDHAPRG